MDERHSRLFGRRALGGLTLALALALPAAAIPASAATGPVTAVAVYLRVGTVELKGPREATRHVSLEVHYSDGRAAWIGAYPNGYYQNFASTGGRLLCEFNAEPRTAGATLYPVAIGERAVPLVSSLARSCTEFNALPPVAYVPTPSAAGDLPDNDFVFGLLRGQGYAVRSDQFALPPKPGVSASLTAKPPAKPQSSGAVNQTLK